MRPNRRTLPLLAFAITTVTAHEARTQSPTKASATSGCTYQTCAIRLEQGFFSERLVRGATGEAIGTIGVFGSGVDTLLAGSDSAAAHARTYLSNTRRSGFIGGVGAVLFAVSAVRTDNFRNGRVSTGDAVTAAAGVAAFVVATPFALRARRELARAIWWYNGALPR